RRPPAGSSGPATLATADDRTGLVRSHTGDLLDADRSGFPVHTLPDPAGRKGRSGRPGAPRNPAYPRPFAVRAARLRPVALFRAGKAHDRTRLRLPGAALGQRGARCNAPHPTDTSIVISALRSFEIGQPAFAFSARSRIFASGASAFTFVTRCAFLTVGPPSVVGSSEMVEVVSMLSGVIPSPPISAARNIESQPAWAAPISSSGFAPFLPP